MRYLKQRETGYVYGWEWNLAQRKDMVEIPVEEAEAFLNKNNKKPAAKPPKDSAFSSKQ